MCRWVAGTRGPVVTTGPTAMWYLTRSTGLVALVLLTAVVVVGIVTSMGWRSPRWPRFVSQAVHRNLSLFCILLIAVHIVTTVTDGFAPIGYLDAVIPFRSPYRPLWLGFGALALDLLLVVALTSAVRHRIGFRTWRGIHWLAYASWPVAVLHGLGTGTDAAQRLMLGITAVCVAAVVGALGWRLVTGWPARPAQRLLGGGAAALFVVGAAALAVVGPLRPGWARRAGTPPSILAALGRSSGSAPAGTTTSGSAAPGGATSGSAASGAAPAGTAAPSGPAAPGGALPAGSFSADLAGTMTTSQPDGSGQIVVEIKGRLSGGVTLPFDISLQGTPSGGGVEMSSGQVTVGPARGPVVGLEGSRILADLGSGSTTVRVSFRLAIDQSSGAVTGTVRSAGAGAGAGAGDDSGATG